MEYKLHAFAPTYKNTFEKRLHSESAMLSLPLPSHPWHIRTIRDSIDPTLILHLKNINQPLGTL